MESKKDVRQSITVSPRCAEVLRELQGALERKVGFEPSLAQTVEYAATQYLNYLKGESK